MNPLRLVDDLSRQGVRFRWTGSGVRASGDLGRLTPDYKRAIAADRDNFTTVVKWQTLQDESESTYGGTWARFYPFCRLELKDAPRVRTADGEGRIAQVMPAFVRVVLEADYQTWLDQGEKPSAEGLAYLPMNRMEFHQVFPPMCPPEVRENG